MVVTKVIETMLIQNVTFSNGESILFPVNRLKDANNAVSRTRAKATAIDVYNHASIIN